MNFQLNAALSIMLLANGWELAPISKYLFFAEQVKTMQLQLLGKGEISVYTYTLVSPYDNDHPQIIQASKSL